jgi:hypothetical protein
MKNKELMNNVTRVINRAGMKIRKHSPEILLAVGVVGTVTSAVLACKATTKLQDILESGKENINQLNDYVADHGYSEKYTEEDAKKDKLIMYTQTGLEVVKLYAPSVALGALSIASILASHGIIHKRNVSLAAAYTTIDKGFKDYRNRVVERFGKELDRELKYNIKTKEVERTVTHEDGTESTVKETIQVARIDEPSEFARFFDEWCTGWDKDPEYNLTYLKNVQRMANDRLEANGHLFLNEVYDMLGIPRSKAGNIVGWVYDRNDKYADNYVDFGIYDVHNEQKRDFVNGRERSILLDFNVDGNIWELLN